MCGIAGVWGSDDGPAVLGMLERMAHRGPDGMGLDRICPGAVLAHRRLAIMDPKGGAQPLVDSTRGRALVANGEVYNHRALRADLSQRHDFRTNSDSEAVLHLYSEAGPHTCEHLDGMFAVAVNDEDGLYLARDPLGIKPLYTAVDPSGSVIWFASEIKAFAGLGAARVTEFPNGHWYHSEHGLQRYFDLPYPGPIDVALGDAVSMVLDSLREAVAKRMMSDVPVGAFLSGGLDSSLLCALARPMVDSLHTFSVGVEGSRDLLAARSVAAHLGTEHHEYAYTPEEVARALPEILYHLESFDQDLVRSAIPCYFCSKLAAGHVKVVLTGEGADELFAGYTYHRELSGSALQRELHRSVLAMHNINLQRVDRLTMAHGIEGRVPFLDLAVVNLALSLPVEHKLGTDALGGLVPKYVLRLAADGLLPPEIVWRRKEQFDEGTGTVDLLPTTLADAMHGFDADHYRDTHPQDRLRSAEEAYYHHVLHGLFAAADVPGFAVGRWVDREIESPLAAHPLAKALPRLTACHTAGSIHGSS